MRHVFSSDVTLWVRRLVAGLAVAACVCAGSTAWAQGEPAPPPAEGEPPPPADEPIPPAYTQTDRSQPPPPGYGPPPPGYGPPPDPYNYGVPPGTPPTYDPDDWQEGDPIPRGYKQDTRIRKGLVIGGAVTLGSLWIISIIWAGIGASIEEADAAIDATFCNSVPTDPACQDEVGPEDWYVLMIPVAGPFVAIGTLQAEGAGTAFLLIDGIAQAGGLAMLIAGIAAQETYIRPVPQYGDFKLQISPVTAPAFQGLGVKGTF